MKRNIVVEIISFLLTFLFVYAALNKILDYQKFQTQLLQSPIVANVSGFIAIAVPVSEIVISIALVIPKFRLVGLYASFFLMTAFTTYIVVILNFSFYVPCSCGGVLDKLGWTEHLIFNSVFSLLAVVGIICKSWDRQFSTTTR